MVDSKEDAAPAFNLAATFTLTTPGGAAGGVAFFFFFFIEGGTGGMVGVDDGNGNSTCGDNGFATCQSAAGACDKGRGGTTNVGGVDVVGTTVVGTVVGTDDEIEDVRVVVDEVSSGIDGAVASGNDGGAAAGGNCDGAAAGGNCDGATAGGNCDGAAAGGNCGGAAAGGNCDGATAGDVVIICVFCSIMGKSTSTFEICGSEAALNDFFLFNVSFRFVVTTSICLRSNAFN